MQTIERATLPLLAAVCLALAGCGDGLSKSSLAEIIDEYNVKNFDPECWSVDRKPAQLPLTVTLSQELEPILDGLENAGLITATMVKQEMFGSSWTIDLTDAGRKAGVWDENKGFCVGQRRVHEVVRWTEPSHGQKASFVEVTYTWQLKDRPKWAKPELFPDVKGMIEPVESGITLVKTSDGWRTDR